GALKVGAACGGQRLVAVSPRERRRKALLAAFGRRAARAGIDAGREERPQGKEAARGLHVLVLGGTAHGGLVHSQLLRPFPQGERFQAVHAVIQKGTLLLNDQRRKSVVQGRSV